MLFVHPRMVCRALLLSVLAAALLQRGGALLAKGSVTVPAGRSAFITKFCFDYGAGQGVFAPAQSRISFRGMSPATGHFDVVWLDDQQDSYPNENAMRDWKCDSQHLKHAAKYRQSVSASDPVWTKLVPIKENVRPRWWYLMVVDCSGVERKLDYSVHLTNPNQDRQQEFSMDQCGLKLMGACFLVYTLMVLAQLKAIHTKSETSCTKHPLRLLLLCSIALAALGMMASVFDGFLFSRTGESPLSLHLTGKVLKASSKLALACMLLLLSEGTCISKSFRYRDLWRMLGALAPFFTACLVLELWGEYAQSRTYTTGFVYCTWFGAALVIGDLCLLALYLRSMYRSYSNEFDTDKKSFYRLWGPLYSCSFAALPFAALLSLVVSPWVRAEIMFSVTNGVHATMLCLLVIGLWPEKTQRFFCIDNDELPHTIGIMSDLLTKEGMDAEPCLLNTLASKRTDAWPKCAEEFTSNTTVVSTHAARGLECEC